MKTLVAAAAVALCLVATTARAADLPADVQANLQSSMHGYLDSVSVGGAYRFLDPTTSKVTVLYPANTHPMVLGFGDDFFVCSDMVDESGTSHTADFLVRRFGEEYRVVQMLVGQRAVVEAAMKAAGK
ncbi:MAG: hypothetical protein LDL26_05115 [Caenispirillum bisanense]|nr:hypothetical protein [Caenispirillum bisanense]MCA1972794.1 hypothetical protein [Caenispirillum sp.]